MPERSRAANRASMSACDLCVVRNRAICAALDKDEIEALNNIGRRRQLEPGESLMW